MGDALSYDAENRLKQVVTSGGIASRYTYNGDGARVKKVVSSTTTYYVGNYFEVTSAGATTKYYYFAAQRVAMKQGSAVTYLHGDHLGSTSVTTGATSSAQTYYAFGVVRTTSGTLPTDYTFTGQKVDSYIKLLQMGARWYDYETGRFIQPDTIVPDWYNPQSLNRYAYTLNNPVKGTDPTGHWTCDIYDSSCAQNADDERSFIEMAYDVTVDQRFGTQDLREIRDGLDAIASKAGGVEGARNAVRGVDIQWGPSGRSYQLWGTTVITEVDLSRRELWATESVIHELAHYWDWSWSDPLTQLFNLGQTSISMHLQTNEIGPTGYANDPTSGPGEIWAESVAMFVLPEYADFLRGSPTEFVNGVYIEPGLRPQKRDFVSSMFDKLKRGVR